MRWFKHMTETADDEKISALIEDTGLEGYGFWWRIMEIVGKQVDENDKCSAKFSPKKWGNSLGISPKKFGKLAEKCAEIGLFSVKFEENAIEISIPNILKYKDEWTKKRKRNSGVAPVKAPKQVRCKETDTDTELNNTISKGGNINNNILNISSPDPLLTPPSPDEKNSPQNAPVTTQEKNKPCIEPSGYFNQLRTVYNRFKNEGSIAGWHEFQAYCKDKSNPDVLTLICDLETRSETDQWKKGYVPSMARYLREKLWEQPTEELQDCKKNQPEDLAAYYERMKNKQNSEAKTV